MSKDYTIIAHVYTKELREAVSDTGLARKTFVLVADEQGNLVKKETMLPGPRAKIKLISTRALRVERSTDPRMPARIMIRGNQNNPRLSSQWLELTPVWRKVGDHEELAAILDSRNSKINFEMLDDGFEQPPTPAG